MPHLHVTNQKNEISFNLLTGLILQGREVWVE
jgi:hypothetical protein